MAVKVRIPAPLRNLTKGNEQIEASGKTVAELLEDMEKNYPGLKDRLCDERGQLRRFVNVYINEEDIRFLKGGQSEIKEGDDISIIPAIAGGR